MAPGIPIPVDGPLPQPLPNGLIAVATIQPEADERWQGGLTVYQYPCPATAWVVIDPCGSTALHQVQSGTVQHAPSFGVAAGLHCTASGIGNEALFRQRAAAIFAAYEQFFVEREVETNTIAGDFQLSSLTNIAGSFDVAHGIAELEERRSALGVLHLTPRLATLAYAARVVDRDTRGRLYTANGTPVVTGAGYQAAKGSTTDEARITGPVELRRGPLIVNPPTLADALSRDQNDVTFYAERLYAVEWSACEAFRLSITR